MPSKPVARRHRELEVGVACAVWASDFHACSVLAPAKVGDADERTAVLVRPSEVDWSFVSWD